MRQGCYVHFSVESQLKALQVFTVAVIFNFTLNNPFENAFFTQTHYTS